MPGFASYPQLNFEEFIEEMEGAVPRLPRQEAKLAQFILLNLNTLGLETGKSLATKVGVSEVTVGRLLRRLGCNGMKELKKLLRQQYSVASPAPEARQGVHVALEQVMEAEIGVVTAIFQQTTNADWERASALLAGAGQVFVTGFQSVRGIAEDFARRLSLARGHVAYLSPHDGMLAEWARVDGRDAEESCLVLVDVVPYAREAIDLARLAREEGRACVVVSDEYCHWSRGIADAVIYAPSRTGLFLESTLGIVLALSLLVDAVAAAHPDESRERLLQWKAHAKRLKLF